MALQMSLAPRRERQAVAVVAGVLMLPRRAKRRTVYDAGGKKKLPGRIVRTEGSRPVKDAAVNEAYEFTGSTYDYFRAVHDRRSLDDRGMRLESSVHFGTAFNNAHWDGRQMIFGDGDGKYFRRFTSSLDVVAHELTHGVTQYAAAPGFSGQVGALAEHFADVFGVLTRQYASKQSAARASWLVGAELLTRRVEGEAIRSMKAPGRAYDDPVLGSDPQPWHMRDFVRTDSDDRGVHINSGIPNHAFYRLATALGGRAWEVAGKIWYRVLTRDLGPRTTFQRCADATWRAAGELFGSGSEPQDAVRLAWRGVGIAIQDEKRRPGTAVARPPGISPASAVPTPAFEPPTAGAELPVFAG